MDLRTCVAPSGRFFYGIHKPQFQVANLRQTDRIASIGSFRKGDAIENRANFPAGHVDEPGAEWIYEIPNAFPFRGTTYILKSWAEENTHRPSEISLPQPQSLSFSGLIKEWFEGAPPSKDKIDKMYENLPEPLQLAIAANSTDPDDLKRLAQLSCDFIYSPDGSRPVGLVYDPNDRQDAKPSIKNRTLFDVLTNNFYLPDDFKEVMVLRPGAQGHSEIVGEWQSDDGDSHVYEYLRRNSYVPWGHYAANMADDAVRYRISDLTDADMTGMRHLYYQRTYIRLAQELELVLPPQRKMLSPADMESLRCKINEALNTDEKKSQLQFNATLWGWNFGFDFSPSRYRLHASHQQIHQQYALIPRTVTAMNGDVIPGEKLSAYGCGDLIGSFGKQYRKQTGKGFFKTYIKAIRTNRRMDGRKNREKSLVVYEDDRVMVFVPKAQTSQWEIQLMTLKPVGNILEADGDTRRALDRALLITMKILSVMGAKMVTAVECSKRFDHNDNDQRLLYWFLPRMPGSPGAFSEQQLRWINGHYPEDFAAACRTHLPEVLKLITH